MGWLTALANGLKALAITLGWAKQAADETTGEKLAAGEVAKETVDEVQAVNDARADPANLERVRRQSFRD